MVLDMTANPSNRSIDFFDAQFRLQSAAGEYALNPFEHAVLPFLAGEVLELGCGLGNLSLAAAERGCRSNRYSTAGRSRT